MSGVCYTIYMNINIKATGIELTPAIKEYAEKKVGMLEKYFAPGQSPNIQVEVGKSTAHHRQGPFFRAEVRVSGSGTDYYAVSENEDLYAAIDLVKDEIVHEITHSQKKRLSKLRAGGRRMKDMMRRWWK